MAVSSKFFLSMTSVHGNYRVVNVREILLLWQVNYSLGMVGNHTLVKVRQIAWLRLKKGEC